jgi:uncharacterized damage-inducible protein DinB
MTEVERINSIWEIVLHIAAWERVGLERLQGERAEYYNTPEDWPIVNGKDEAAWMSAIEKLMTGHALLTAAIKQIDDSRLDEPILEGMSAVYVTLHGIIQHDVYHAGQIALLKRHVSQSDPGV